MTLNALCVWSWTPWQYVIHMLTQKMVKIRGWSLAKALSSLIKLAVTLISDSLSFLALTEITVSFHSIFIMDTFSLDLQIWYISLGLYSSRSLAASLIYCLYYDSYQKPPRYVFKETWLAKLSECRKIVSINIEIQSLRPFKIISLVTTVYKPAQNMCGSKLYILYPLFKIPGSWLSSKYLWGV